MLSPALAQSAESLMSVGKSGHARGSSVSSLGLYSDAEKKADFGDFDATPVYSSALDSESARAPKPRRTAKPRRRLRNSDVSARLEAPSGYTSTPATGKIFRNLLIVEESLRQQVMQQRALRRKYLTFLALLCLLLASGSHYLYFSDVSGAPRVGLQLALLALGVTLMLYHLSGEYQETIVLPRRFLSSTNKGLRQLNVRLVKIKTPFGDATVDLMREVGLVLCTALLRLVRPSRLGPSRLERFLVQCQLQCQPRFGLNDVKLVLNPRNFNTAVREGWETYRNEFWIMEGVRRRNAIMSGLDPKRRKRRKTLALEELLDDEVKLPHIT